MSGHGSGRAAHYSGTSGRSGREQGSDDRGTSGRSGRGQGAYFGESSGRSGPPATSSGSQLGSHRSRPWISVYDGQEFWERGIPQCLDETPLGVELRARREAERQHDIRQQAVQEARERQQAQARREREDNEYDEEISGSSRDSSRRGTPSGDRRPRSGQQSIRQEEPRRRPAPSFLDMEWERGLCQYST